MLHFRFTLIPSTNCSDILPQLEKIDVLEGYSKSERYYKNQRINLVGRINESLPTAIKNAKRLGDFDIYNPYNPVVEIYKLFEGYF